MAIYNFDVGVGTRRNGSSASDAVQYIVEESDSDISDVFYDNIPEFAQDNPADFFKAVDQKDSKKATLFRSMRGSIPKELTRNQAVELVKNFVREVTGDFGYPVAVAFHNLNGNNPHFHCVFSEHKTLFAGVNRDEIDGVVRDKDLFFHRANSKNPERGGIPKAKLGSYRRDWLKGVRKLWEIMNNMALESAGSKERVSCETLVKQGILDRTPAKKISWMSKRWEKIIAKQSRAHISKVRKHAFDDNGCMLRANDIELDEKPEPENYDRWAEYQEVNDHWYVVRDIKRAVKEVEENVFTKPLVDAIENHDRAHQVTYDRQTIIRLALLAEKEREKKKKKEAALAASVVDAPADQPVVQKRGGFGIGD